MTAQPDSSHRFITNAAALGPVPQLDPVWNHSSAVAWPLSNALSALAFAAQP